MPALRHSTANQDEHGRNPFADAILAQAFYFAARRADRACGLLVSENALSILYGSGALLQVLICGERSEKHIRVSGSLSIK